MSDAVAAVGAWAAGLEELAGLPGRLGAQAAPGIEAAAQASIAAGTKPSGEPWAPTKDGHAPLEGAGGELAVAPLENGVRLELNGPSAIHHNGTGHSPRRQVLPDDGEVPAAYAEAIDAAFVEAVR